MDGKLGKVSFHPTVDKFKRSGDEAIKNRAVRDNVTSSGCCTDVFCCFLMFLFQLTFEGNLSQKAAFIAIGGLYFTNGYCSTEPPGAIKGNVTPYMYVTV